MVAASILRAQSLGIPCSEDSRHIVEFPVAAATQFPPYAFHSSEEFTSPEAIQRQREELPPSSSLQQCGWREDVRFRVKTCPVEFEKDDDSNHHIDFIAACSNLRAEK